MQRCPTCHSTYADRTLAFCLTDGSPLIREPTDSFDPAQTLASPPPAPTSSPLPPTQVVSAGQTPGYQPSYQSQWTPPQQWNAPPTARSGSKNIIMAVVGLLLLVGVGLEAV